MSYRIRWVDGHREPQCKPNPQYPNGIDIPPPPKVTNFCKVDLPYPAKRCGVYTVLCDICGSSVALTTAGRVDDPRSVAMECNIETRAQ